MKKEQPIPAVHLDIIRSKQDAFIRVEFPYQTKLIAQVKQNKSARWNPDYKGWLFEAGEDKFRQITAHLSPQTEAHSEAAAQAKCKKDRLVPLSTKLLESQRQYYVPYRPKRYVFEGQDGGLYSEASLAKVLTTSLERAGINEPVTLHWLRHSYTTHLLERGTDLRYIQELLGHNSSRTTEIFTHVSQHNLQQIRSPFDDL